jgi:hypothetical protein
LIFLRLTKDSSTAATASPANLLIPAKIDLETARYRLQFHGAIRRVKF